MINIYLFLLAIFLRGEGVNIYGIAVGNETNMTALADVYHLEKMGKIWEYFKIYYLLLVVSRAWK